MGRFLMCSLLFETLSEYFVKDIHGYKRRRTKIEIKIVDKTCCFIMEKYKLITPQLLPIIVLRWCAKELVVELT